MGQDEPGSPADSRAPAAGPTGGAAGVGGVVATILAYNARDTIAGVVAAVRSQTHPVARILIVDNGSTDGTADHCRATLGDCTPYILLFRTQRRRRLAARVLGVRDGLTGRLGPASYRFLDDGGSPTSAP